MRRIILVEDDLLLANDIKNILKDSDAEIIINIKTYDEAIIAINELRPDLVIIDVKLKGTKTGIQLGAYLLESELAPYIYLTGSVDRLTLDNIKDTRPYGFITKPYKEVNLKTMVDIVINNYEYKFVDIKRNYSFDEIEDDSPFVIKKIINYIDANIYEKIDIKKLASLTHWKGPHFIRMFTKIMGQTPYQYILKRKIEKSKILLSETNQSLNEIAYDLGFYGYNNFYIAFKKFNNTTPEAYRLEKRVQSNYNYNYTFTSNKIS